jgi:hypothetical protein
MYARAKKSSLHNLRQAVDNQYKAKQQKLQMPVLRRQSKKGKSKLNLGDYILDKLYSIDKHKDDICFLTLVVVVSYFGCHVIRGLM